MRVSSCRYTTLQDGTEYLIIHTPAAGFQTYAPEPNGAYVVRHRENGTEHSHKLAGHSERPTLTAGSSTR